ncbi:hypothetical protein P3T36_002994 [Kitasatospora sp. MAP12-15]|uniref:hypothetical protein n=1 Tax=unclassified Kitasatospora TaxID=2633591 RepID=UPI002473A81B|nr:hypothetical protein [Kitasatospora sp. MAP12-44]MDH6108863.1 hypothetical protein [Kitasatospora sp. MAP12-44]
MTVPSSTATAVRAWLYGQLSAQLAPDPLSKTSSLLVCYDEPGPEQPDDIVAIGKVSRQLSLGAMVGGGGAGWIDERYSVEITIDVYRGGDDSQGAYSRAAVLCDAICSIVRSDLTLGGNVITARPLSSTHEVAWEENHAGRQATTTLEVECFQRI